jgi:hypothetical protein
MTIHIELGPDEERALLEQARLSGRDPVQYAQQIIREQIKRPTREVNEDESSTPTHSIEDLIDHEFVESCARLARSDSPSIEEVRESLSKIRGSLSDEIIADREDRF